MHGRSKHKSDTDLSETIRNALWRNGDVHAQGFHHVSRTASGRDAAIAVLGHAHARACDGESRCGGDVKSVTGIAAGSTGIDQRFTFGAADIQRAAVTVRKRHRRSADSFSKAD